MVFFRSVSCSLGLVIVRSDWMIVTRRIGKETKHMDKVRSKDGTAIAFDRLGEGPPIILVVGAFNAESST